MVQISYDIEKENGGVLKDSTREGEGAELNALLPLSKNE